LAGPFLVPVLPLERTVPPRELADPDSQFAEVDGLTVHYKTAGEGQPILVLLHGFDASIFSWREVKEPLGKLGRVIAFDRPAFGLAARPIPGECQGDTPYSPEAQADLTVELMDHLGVEKAVLVGNSASGTISVLTAWQPWCWSIRRSTVVRDTCLGPALAAHAPDAPSRPIDRPHLPVSGQGYPRCCLA